MARGGEGLSMSLVGVSYGGKVGPENCLKELCSLLEYAVEYVSEFKKITVFMRKETETLLRGIIGGGNVKEIEISEQWTIDSLKRRSPFQMMGSIARTVELMLDWELLVNKNEKMKKMNFFMSPLVLWKGTRVDLLEGNVASLDLFAFTCCAQVFV